MRISDWSSDVCSSDLSFLLTSTAALLSKRITEPSARRTSLAVRTITARCTSPFFTLPRGWASLIDTTMTSPTPATRRFDPPSTLMRSEEHTSELQSLMRISYAVFCLQQKKQTYSH